MGGNEAREGACVWVARCPCTSVCQTPVFQVISKERLEGSRAHKGTRTTGHRRHTVSHVGLHSSWCPPHPML